MKKKSKISLTDFDDYLNEKKKNDPAYKNYEKEYEEYIENFKIGELVKEMRLNADMTQEDLAEKINSTKNSISRLENHYKDIKLSTLIKIATALGKKINVDSLFIDA